MLRSTPGTKNGSEAKTSVDSKGFDPHKNSRFRITMDGKIVASIDDISGLVPPPGSGKKKLRKKMPGRQNFGNITFQRTIIQDTKFWEWINSSLSNSRSEGGAANLRRSMTIEFCNDPGEVISSYRLINGWVTKMDAKTIKANTNDVGIESIELSYESLELIKS
jgi:phage tail-like protein